MKYLEQREAILEKPTARAWMKGSWQNIPVLLLTAKLYLCNWQLWARLSTVPPEYSGYYFLVSHGAKKAATSVPISTSFQIRNFLEELHLGNTTWFLKSSEQTNSSCGSRHAPVIDKSPKFSEATWFKMCPWMKNFIASFLGHVLISP